MKNKPILKLLFSPVPSQRAWNFWAVKFFSALVIISTSLHAFATEATDSASLKNMDHPLLKIIRSKMTSLMKRPCFQVIDTSQVITILSEDELTNARRNLSYFLDLVLTHVKNDFSITNGEKWIVDQTAVEQMDPLIRSLVTDFFGQMRTEETYKKIETFIVSNNDLYSVLTKSSSYSSPRGAHDVKDAQASQLISPDPLYLEAIIRSWMSELYKFKIKVKGDVGTLLADTEWSKREVISFLSLFHTQVDESLTTEEVQKVYQLAIQELKEKQGH